MVRAPSSYCQRRLPLIGAPRRFSDRRLFDRRFFLSTSSRLAFLWTATIFERRSFIVASPRLALLWAASIFDQRFFACYDVSSTGVPLSDVSCTWVLSTESQCAFHRRNMFSLSNRIGAPLLCFKALFALESPHLCFCSVLFWSVFLLSVFIWSHFLSVIYGYLIFTLVDIISDFTFDDALRWRTFDDERKRLLKNKRSLIDKRLLKNKRLRKNKIRSEGVTIASWCACPLLRS